jgi:hypothetical protein
VHARDEHAFVAPAADEPARLSDLALDRLQLGKAAVGAHDADAGQPPQVALVEAGAARHAHEEVRPPREAAPDLGAAELAAMAAHVGVDAVVGLELAPVAAHAPREPQELPGVLDRDAAREVAPPAQVLRGAPAERDPVAQAQVAVLARGDRHRADVVLPDAAPDQLLHVRDVASEAELGALLSEALEPVPPLLRLRRRGELTLAHQRQRGSQDGG